MSEPVPLSHLPADEKALRASSFGGVATDYERFRPGPPLAVRSLGKAEDGQPKFRRLVSQSGKPTRLQQSIKLCDRDEEHKTKNSLAVLILAQRLDQQIDSWESDADKADGTEELRPCGDMPVANFFETVFMPYIQANKEASTAKSYQSYWNAYLRDHFNGTKTLRGYEAFQGTNLIEKLAKEYSDNTINHVRALASAIFSYACAKGYIQYTPWRDMRKTKQTAFAQKASCQAIFCRARQPSSPQSAPGRPSQEIPETTQ